ncbi:BA14K family protein [Microvirga terricola]|uniref:Lectin-like protein BA14k n=1 Tax=Microvirga terricola TaxID=2719797 RepID=A0ABX0VD27_9HYPH|nr:BA14K family protein [Microvirga terricola]NIX75747.1 BA14K family protein [Microvirga terricola]
MRRGIVTALVASAAASLVIGAGVAQAQIPPNAQTPSQYYSPTNPKGYSYGYRRGAAPASTGTVQAGPSRGQTWISYCSHKYRSYDPRSNTYWGADGKQHICR